MLSILCVNSWNSGKLRNSDIRHASSEGLFLPFSIGSLERKETCCSVHIISLTKFIPRNLWHLASKEAVQHLLRRINNLRGSKVAKVEDVGVVFNRTHLQIDS